MPCCGMVRRRSRTGQDAHSGEGKSGRGERLAAVAALQACKSRSPPATEPCSRHSRHEQEVRGQVQAASQRPTLPPTQVPPRMRWVLRGAAACSLPRCRGMQRGANQRAFAAFHQGASQSPVCDLEVPHDDAVPVIPVPHAAGPGTTTTRGTIRCLPVLRVASCGWDAGPSHWLPPGWRGTPVPGRPVPGRLTLGLGKSPVVKRGAGPRGQLGASVSVDVTLASVLFPRSIEIVGCSTDGSP